MKTTETPPPPALLENLQGAQHPLIVYDTRGIETELDLLRGHLAQAFEGRRDPLLLYSVKANMFPGLLRWFATRGVGAAVASIPEYTSATRAGMSPVCATAPGLTGAQVAELTAAGVLVDVDSVSQLEALPTGADVGLRLRVPLMPDNTGREEGLSRFGVDPDDPRLEAALAAGSHTVTRLHGHFRDVGTESDLEQLARIMLDAARRFPHTRSINLGGGMTRLYHEPSRAAEAWRLCAKVLAPLAEEVRVIVEPGAQVVTSHGYIGMSVVSAQTRPDGRQLVVVDTSRWQLVSWSDITLVSPAPLDEGRAVPTDLVGPTCYEKDVWLARADLPTLRPGDRVVFRGVGAYVASMARRMHGLPGPDEIVH